jgi:hypothetical protein
MALTAASFFLVFLLACRSVSTATEPMRAGSRFKQRLKNGFSCDASTIWGHDGKLRSYENVMERIVSAAALPQDDIFTALGDHTEGEIRYTVGHLRG